MKVVLTILLPSLLAACDPAKPWRHERLISFNSYSVMDMDSLVKNMKMYDALHSNKFNYKTDTILFGKGRIYISYLALLNGCAEYDGTISFRNDWLFVGVVNVGDMACTEQRCDRLVFVIENKENRKYKIARR